MVRYPAHRGPVLDIDSPALSYIRSYFGHPDDHHKMQEAEV